jgi:hypothetical protein
MLSALQHGVKGNIAKKAIGGIIADGRNRVSPRCGCPKKVLRYEAV